MNEDRGSGARPWIKTKKNHLISLKNCDSCKQNKGMHSIQQSRQQCRPPKGKCIDEHNTQTRNITWPNSYLAFRIILLSLRLSITDGSLSEMTYSQTEVDPSWWLSQWGWNSGTTRCTSKHELWNNTVYVKTWTLEQHGVRQNTNSRTTRCTSNH